MIEKNMDIISLISQIILNHCYIGKILNHLLFGYHFIFIITKPSFQAIIFRIVFRHFDIFRRDKILVEEIRPHTPFGPVGTKPFRIN